MQVKTASSKPQTPYNEFLKLLHIYACQLITKDDLTNMLTVLFWYGHGPRPAQAAGKAEAFPDDPERKAQVDDLMSIFAQVLAGRGPFAAQER